MRAADPSHEQNRVGEFVADRYEERAIDDHLEHAGWPHRSARRQALGYHRRRRRYCALFVHLGYRTMHNPIDPHCTFNSCIRRLHQPLFWGSVCADGRVSPLWQIPVVIAAQGNSDTFHGGALSVLFALLSTRSSAITTSIHMECVLDRATRFKASRPGEVSCAML